MKKKLISILLCTTMTALLLAGCGTNSSESADTSSSEEATTETDVAVAETDVAVAETAEPSEGELPILGAGIYSSSDNFNSYIGKAIVNASDGVLQTNIQDGQNDQSTQNNQIDTMLAKGASCIAVSVVDVTAATVIIDKCKEAGNVPIIFFNKEITDQNIISSYENCYQVTSTGGDYGAAIQGQMIVEYWNSHPEMDKNGDGKLQIIDIMGDPGHTAAQPRADFVKSEIQDSGVEYELLEEDTGMWDTAKAKEKMDAWISKYGNEVECIICANDAMALGALQSIEAAGFNADGPDGDQYIPIIGIDALPEMLDKIESGEVMGSVLQDAKTQGQTIVKMAQNLTGGKDVLEGIDFELEEGAKAIRVPYAAITVDNLDLAKSTYAE